MSNDSVSASGQPGPLERIRSGDDTAFGELFQAHEGAVRRLARGLASDAAEADDITAETFFRVLQAVRRGNGPTTNVRAYLLTVARRVAWEWQRARRDVPVTDDELAARAGVSADGQSHTAEAALITRAFSSLPERWRIVLWHTEVEGEQPAVVAPHFGLSANATAALARRARIGLRAAYLQAHLATDRGPGGCRGVLRKLGGYTAGSVTGAEARKISTHLATCGACRATHDELRKVCSALRAHASTLIVLIPLSGLLLVTSSGVGAGALAVGASSSAASGMAGVALAVGGGGKFGVTLVSAAAVVGMVGPPIVDVAGPGARGSTRGEHGVVATPRGSADSSPPGSAVSDAVVEGERVSEPTPRPPRPSTRVGTRLVDEVPGPPDPDTLAARASFGASGPLGPTDFSLPVSVRSSPAPSSGPASRSNGRAEPNSSAVEPVPRVGETGTDVVRTERTGPLGTSVSLGACVIEGVMTGPRDGEDPEPVARRTSRGGDDHGNVAMTVCTG